VPETVLVVENDPMSRELARRVLTAGGYRTLLAFDAEEALRVAAAEVPDLVLMDLGLPGIDGIEATKQMHAQPATASVPVAVLSAQAFDEIVARASAAGCVGYLTKPIGARELLDRVAELIAAESPMPKKTKRGKA
jgi:two-component system, cell cycle response regulator DivK